MINFIRSFILSFVMKHLLEKHKFKASSLIIRDGTRTLFEVDTNYYNKELEPVTIVRAYPSGTQLLGISKHEIIEFREYKKMPEDALSTTTHDNRNFANYKKDK